MYLDYIGCIRTVCMWIKWLAKLYAVSYLWYSLLSSMVVDRKGKRFVANRLVIISMVTLHCKFGVL